MNTPIAENRFTLNRALFTEGMLRVWSRSGGSSTKKLMAVIALAWLALTAYTLTQGGSFVFPLLELCIFALVYVWATVWLPRSKARQAYRALEARGTADAERSIRFFEDHLEAEAGGQLISLPYSDLSQTLRSANLLILLSADKTGILVKRGSFILGTEEEVLRLIQNAKEEAHSHD